MTIVMGQSHHVQHDRGFHNTTATDALLTRPPPAQHSPFFLGFMAMLTASFCSSLGDVGTEFVFKNYAKTQHFVGQTLALYFFGMVFNGMALIYVNWDTLAYEYSKMIALDIHIAGAVIVNAIVGILIGLVFRFAVGGNITKIFANAGALMLTLILAWVFLNKEPEVDVLCGLVIVYCAIFLYASQKEECERINNLKGEDQSNAITLLRLKIKTRHSE